MSIQALKRQRKRWIRGLRLTKHALSSERIGQYESWGVRVRYNYETLTNAA